MPLQGTFDVLDFTEVLHLIARHELTGRLHVRSRSFGANLFIDRGELIGADQSEHQATATSGDVRSRLEEICFEMLDAERGTFEFQPGRASVLPPSTHLEVADVVARTRARQEEWQVLQESLPSLDVAPRLAEDLSGDQVTIDQERWRLLTVIDGRRNLRAIGRTLGLSDFDVCRVVKGLLDDGIIELDARAVAMATSGRETGSTLPTVAVPPAAGAALVPGAGTPAVTRTGPVEARGPDIDGATSTVTPSEPDETVTVVGAGAASAPAAPDASGAAAAAPTEPPGGDTPTGDGDEAAEVIEVDPANGGRRRLVRIRSRSRPG